MELKLWTTGKYGVAKKGDSPLLDDAIEREDWESVRAVIDTLIKKDRLDVWYDYQPLHEAVDAAGFRCYTCFLKYQNVMCKHYRCYSEYENDTLFSDTFLELQRKKCGREKRQQPIK